MTKAFIDNFRPSNVCMRCVLFAVVLIACGLQHAMAQAPDKTTVSVFAGASHYDLSGVGWTSVVGPRIDHELFAPLAVQFAFPVYRYLPQFAPDHLTWVLPELSLLVSPAVGSVSPYIRFGPGWAFVITGRQYGSSEVTLHMALGVRIKVWERWDVRSEVGVRSVNPWTGNTADICGGLGYRF